MKTKNRLLLTSAMMLALVAVSGTTATYAWWVTTLQATASVNTVTAKADADLSVEMKEGYKTKLKEDGETIEVLDAGSLTDVSSGDGLTFHKATLNSNEQVTDLVKVELKDDYANKIYYGIQFSASISMPSLNPGLVYNVYLGDGLGTNQLIDDQSDDTSVRMAVTDSTNIMVFGNSDNKQYQTKDESGSIITAECTNYHQLTGTLTEETVATEVLSFGKVSDKDVYCLGNLDDKTDVIEITFTMWFEGNITKDGVEEDELFKSNIYFYAIKVTETN